MRDIYVWTHAPLVAGIVLMAAGLEEAALHPNDPIPLPFRTIFAAGLVITVAAGATAIRLALRVTAWERIALIVAVAAIAAGSSSSRAVYVIAAIVVVLLIALGVEHFRIEHRPGPPHDRLARAQTTAHSLV